MLQLSHYTAVCHISALNNAWSSTNAQQTVAATQQQQHFNEKGHEKGHATAHGSDGAWTSSNAATPFEASVAAGSSNTRSTAQPPESSQQSIGKTPAFKSISNNTCCRILHTQEWLYQNKLAEAKSTQGELKRVYVSIVHQRLNQAYCRFMFNCTAHMVRSCWHSMKLQTAATILTAAHASHTAVAGETDHCAVAMLYESRSCCVMYAVWCSFARLARLLRQITC